MSPSRYQDIYPSPPLLDSNGLARQSAKELMTLEYFEAEPGSMPTEIFEQHHILLNLKKEPHRVENWRDGEHRDFIYHENEVIVTPAGVESGWRWHAKSSVIVITLDPPKLERFARQELDILLTGEQLKNVPQFIDEDIVSAGILVRDALQSQIGSAVMFESLARVFLTKLIQTYGLDHDEDLAFSRSFTCRHYKRVLDFIAVRFNQEITVEAMAEQAAISPYHFTRLFKQTIGQSPYQFVISYRVEQAKAMLERTDRPLIDIAHACGFSDQAHFSRVFKQATGLTPKRWRA